MMLKSV